MVSRKRTKPLLDALSAELVTQVEAAVRARGVVPLKKLSPIQLTRRADAALQERLVRSGLERTARGIRVPLEQQLERLVQEQGLVPLTGLKARLLGAVSQTEVKQVALTFVSRGSGRLVVSQGKQFVGGPTVDVLEPPEADVLAGLTKALVDLLKQARPKRGQPQAALLRSDVASVIQALARLPMPSESRGGRVREDAEHLVVDAVRALEAAESLVFVPDVVRRLAGELEVEQVHRALLAGSRAGRLELRPESGIQTLSPEDRRLCLPGPQGSVLSYVRCL